MIAKNFHTNTVRLKVIGVDAYKAEERLRASGFVDDANFDYEYSTNMRGNYKKEKTFRVVLVKNSIRVFIADPGELCFRLEGDKTEIKNVLMMLKIPVSSFDKVVS